MPAAPAERQGLRAGRAIDGCRPRQREAGAPPFARAPGEAPYALAPPSRAGDFPTRLRTASPDSALSNCRFSPFLAPHVRAAPYAFHQLNPAKGDSGVASRARGGEQTMASATIGTIRRPRYGQDANGMAPRRTPRTSVASSPPVGHPVEYAVKRGNLSDSSRLTTRPRSRTPLRGCGTSAWAFRRGLRRGLGFLIVAAGESRPECRTFVE
jgi:hypothetical protein